MITANIKMNFDQEALSMLVRQKAELFDLINKGTASEKMMGLIHMLDSVQDQLVSGEYFTDKQVFHR